MTPFRRLQHWLHRRDPADRAADTEWLRISLSADRAWVDACASNPPPGLTPQQTCEAAVVRELASMGLTARVAYQDPTWPEAWFAIVQRVPGIQATSSARLRIENVVPVSPAPDPVPANDPLLDEGLSSQEARAVRCALLRDHDPKRLDGLAETLGEDFPVAQSLVAAKVRRMREAKTLKISGRQLGLLPRQGMPIAEAESYRSLPPLPPHLVPAYRSALSSIVLGDGRDTVGCERDVLRAALSSFTSDRETLDPAAVRHFTASAPGVSPPSNSALQMAFAQLRPGSSGVKDPSMIRRRMGEARAAAAAGDPEAKKAVDQLVRASRFLERANWVAWYERAALAGLL